LAAIGEGEVVYEGKRVPAAEALQSVGIEPLTLEAKEGLALLNGTQAMTAVGGLALLDAERLADAADVTGAMSLEALRGTPVAFDHKIHAVRPHPGQIKSARRLRELIEGSEIRESHRDHLVDPRVQDAYALRCMPQVHGAVRDSLAHARRILEIELNSATDNPLIFAEAGEVLSGGNFHGEPIALTLDYAAVGIADLGTISERRVERLVNPDLSGLPAFLTPEAGMNSGLMIAQIVAASLIAENKEDHVSMGMTAAIKFAQVVRNVEIILAIELMCAAQGLDFLEPLKPSPKLAEAHARVRERVPKLERDAALSGYIESLVPVIRRLGEI
jgi:histidine ammonia-lyase